MFIVTKNAEKKMLAEYERLGISVNVMDLRVNRWKDIRYIRGLTIGARSLPELGRLYRQIRPTVVQAYLPSSNCAAVMARWFTPVPIVIASHRYAGSATLHYNFFQGLEAVVCRQANVNLANSPGVADYLRRTLRLPAKTIRTIFNGAEPIETSACRSERWAVRAELGLVSADIALVKVANLWPYKGYQDLLWALALCAPKEPRLKAFFVGGDRGYRPSLERLIEKLHLRDRVTFLGERSDVCRLLPAFDIFVSASHGEGMSNAIMEAMQHGLPIIGSRVAGTPDLLEDGEAGMLFEPRNIEALSESILAMVSDDTQRQAMASRAAERIRTHFSAEKMVSRTLALYSDIAAEKALHGQAQRFAAVAAEVEAVAWQGGRFSNSGR